MARKTKRPPRFKSVVKVNDLFFELYSAYHKDYRYYVIQGGARAGKTYSILQLLAYLAIDRGLKITVLSVSFTHLSRGALRDFINILNSFNLVEGVHYEHNKTQHIFHFSSGFVEFVSAEKAEKLRGSQRDIAFINECNLLDYDFFVETDIRTREKVFLDFNPVRRFWVHDKILSDEKASKLAYFRKVKTIENKFLSAQQLKAFEVKLRDINFRRAFFEGEIAEDNTLAFYNYDVIDSDVLLKADLLGVGIDIGEGRSENAVVEIYMLGDKYIVNEVFYNVCTYDVLCSFLKSKYRDLYKQITIVADNAASEFINYARSKYDIPVVPCRKLSLEASFQIINIAHISITTRSHNLLSEASSLRWNEKNLVGKKHALDAMRYILHNFLL